MNEMEKKRSLQATPESWKEHSIALRSSRYHEETLITFEMYHRSSVKLGFSFSRAHSRLMWIIFSSDANGGVRQFLPIGELANFTVRLFLQPIAQGGKTKSCSSKFQLFGELIVF